MFHSRFIININIILGKIVEIMLFLRPSFWDYCRIRWTDWMHSWLLTWNIICNFLKDVMKVMTSILPFKCLYLSFDKNKAIFSRNLLPQSKRSQEWKVIVYIFVRPLEKCIYLRLILRCYFSTSITYFQWHFAVYVRTIYLSSEKNEEKYESTSRWYDKCDAMHRVWHTHILLCGKTFKLDLVQKWMRLFR